MNPKERYITSAQQWLKRTGRHNRDARRFITWIEKTTEYWINRIRRNKGVLDDPEQVRRLSQIEGQSYDNLWKLYKSGEHGRQG